MIALTIFRRDELQRKPQRGRRVSLEWGELVRWTAAPIAAATKDEGGGYSLGTFSRDERSKANVERVAALGLDVDDGDARIARVLEVLGRYQAIAYTTHSHTPDQPRCRAIVALSRPVTASEYGDLWDHVAAHLRTAGVEIDTAARDASRLWYLPAHKPGATFDHAAHGGEVLDVARILEHARPRREEIERLQREIAGARAQLGSTPAIDRVRGYLDTIEGAVSGQGGHKTTFRVACIIVANVSDEGKQRALLEQYNARCSPKWSARELEHKLADARRRGDLRPLPERRTA